MAHVHKTHFAFRRNGRFHLNRRGVSQSTAGSRGVRISGINAGYTMFRGSVKSTVYPFHSPVSPSIAILCVAACHHISTGLYQAFLAVWRLPPSVRNRKNYFALLANSLRTANRWQCAPHHIEMFWCQVVASSFSPPGVACDNCPVWSSSDPHPQKPFSKTLELRCLQVSIFRDRPF